MKLLLSTVVCLLLIACQREVDLLPNEQPPAATTCKLVKSYGYNLAGIVADSAMYVYAGDRLVKIVLTPDSDSIVLQYTGNNLTKRIYYNGGMVVGYDELLYGPGGTFSAVKQMADASAFGGAGFECMDSVLLTWNSGKLVKRTRYSVGLSTQVLELEDEHVFEYTGNNITKSISPPYDTTIIQYDAQPNFLKKQGFPHLVADRSFISTDVIPDYYALFLSENNPIKVFDPQQPGDMQVVEYIKDAKGNVTLIKSGGDPLVGYRYRCP